MPNRPEIFSSLSAGIVNGLLILIFQSAYATLIFSGDLSQFLSRGMGVMLFGAFVMGMTVAVFSSFKCAVTAPQDAPTAIMALTAAAILEKVHQSSGAETAFVTVLVAMALTTLATAVFFLLLGSLRLGNLIRFIPYPVVGGFLAGTGWVLVKGAIGIMAGRRLSATDFEFILEPEALMHWLPGFGFAVILLFATRRFRHFLTLPVIIFSALGVFYLLIFASGGNTETAAAQGWLQKKFTSGVSIQWLSPQFLEQAHWRAISRQMGDLATIAIIGVISLLLNASGLELIVRKEVDLNREMRLTGLANLLAGLGSSMVGYMSLSLSAFGYRIGARSRLAGMTSAAICGLALVLGAGITAYFPKPLLGGLLLYLGLTFLLDWLFHAWFRLPRNEYFLVVLILLTIALWGFLNGMILGILIAVLLFALNYSQVNVIKYALSARTFRSNVDRSPTERHALDRTGDSALVLNLQGYIFFGTANAILNRVKQRVNRQSALKYVILDFRQVSGLDSSALNSFEKMQLLAESEEFLLAFANVGAAVRSRFRRSGLLVDHGEIRVFADLDHAMEWVENQLLQAVGIAEQTIDVREEAFIDRILQETGAVGDTRLAARAMMQHFTQRDFDKDEKLITQGAETPGIFLLQSGSVNVILEDDSGKGMRLRSLRPGVVIGELGVYLRQPATATVVARDAVSTLFLSGQALQTMEKQSPEAAAVFHRFIVGVLGERLGNSNLMIRALLD